MSDKIALALMRQLLRTEAIDDEDVNAIADDLDQQGEDHAAHLTRLTIIEASAPSQAEWEVQQRRSRFEVVPDGGNRQA